MVCNAKWDAPTNELFPLLNWMPVHEMFIEKDCNMIFKCLNNLAPKYICQCFKPFDRIRVTRQTTHGALILPHCNSSLYQKSFIFRGTKIWNNLNHDLRCCNSLSDFKRKLRNSNILPSLTAS